MLPRGSESWRRMSRFRRQSQVKPLAAEVLEPRCLLSHTTPHLPEYRVSLTDDFITGRPDLSMDLMTATTNGCHRQRATFC